MMTANTESTDSLETNETAETAQPLEIIVSKDDAVFWLDARGRWRNQHGPFEHKRIIAHFHSAIRWDDKGFYLEQIHSGGTREKVYFHYHDTALFVFDIQVDLPRRAITLILNTGARLPLNEGALQVENDHLYMQWNNLRIKFAEPALLKVSRYLTYASAGANESVRLDWNGHDIE